MSVDFAIDATVRAGLTKNFVDGGGSFSTTGGAQQDRSGRKSAVADGENHEIWLAANRAGEIVYTLAREEQCAFLA